MESKEACQKRSDIQPAEADMVLHEQQRQQRLGNLIEPEHLSMQLQPEATLHEAGGEVSNHRADRDTSSDSPLETEDQSHDRGGAD